jgi:CheY-like chemotaxis protein
MASIRNLSLRNKLFLISVVPLVALLYFVFNTVQAELERKEVMLQVHEEFAEIEQMSKLLHELQIERGLVLGFLATNSPIDEKAMIDQRKTTNIAVTSVQNIFLRHSKSSRILPFLDSLSTYRQGSKNFPDQANNYKMLLLSEMGKTLRTSRNPVIKNHLESHVFLLHSKEYFAQLRSILTSAIGSKKFARGEYGSFAVLKGAAERNYAKFRETASEDIKDFADKKLRGEGIQKASLVIDSLFYDPTALTNLQRDDWWTNSTTIIDLVKEIEDYSLDHVKQIAEAELIVINKTVYTSIAIAILVVVLIAALISVTIKQIVSSISTIRDAAERITNGEVNVHVSTSSTDELGVLSNSFNKMIAVSKKYADAADIIGKGNYDVDVLVRGPSDVLGIALNQMKSNLQRLAHENEVRTWLLTGNNVMNDSMRGDKQLAELANDVINELSTYLNAQIGAVYIRNNGHLQLSGSYAFDSDYKKHVVKLGEGFVGQAAKNARAILFNEVPDDYIKINSGLGQTTPKSVLVYPFEYEGEVKGVVEVGAAKDFSQVDMDLLKMVSNNIGIAVHAAQARERLKQLLEETQRQAEELESQQEELRQFNEELQGKTELLERSEEELRAQQEELQQTNEELGEKASLLEEQKQALESAKMQIEEKVSELEIVSKYKSEFLANMSHELRTPLNSILILTQVMMDNKNKSLTQKEVQYVSTIHHSGNDLLNLINQILDLSKIEAGKMEVDIEDFNVESVIKNIHSSFDEMAKSRSIEFNIQASETIRTEVIQSDNQRVEQILKNFLANAFKFTDRNGKVELRIEHPDKSIRYANKTLNSAGKIISFSVIDTGIGIPKGKFDVIFGAFQQVDGSTKRKYGGTGLGLSICRELSNLLGGEIHLESREGKGSTFTLYLPTDNATLVEIGDKPKNLLDSEVIKSTPVKNNSKLPTSALSHHVNDDRFAIKDSDRKIVIIEDDVQFSSVLLDFVRERKYKGIVAGDGSMGLFYAKQYKPDAILLDMKLPVMSGEEVLRHLKTDSELRHIPVQIISGYSIRNDGLRQGALDFIKKPISREDFSKAMDKIENFVSRKPKKLLIVEDDVQHNLAVKELIGDGDVSCYSAYTGKEGYSLLSQNPYDCVILDMGLPDMSGFEFLEQIKQNEKLNNIPIIVYTGKALSKEENSKLERLANSVVLKTAHSHERLLDETALFLHRVESGLPKDKQKIIRKLHKTEEVLKNKTVLIVDDDVRNLFSLVSVLEQEGMNCITVENGKLAIEALAKSPSIQIVLMDVMMPEMDGYEATSVIRENDAYKNLPIIALTAKAMQGDREKCIEAGMSDYISKPLNVQQLLSLMRVWLYA